jgi:hypothetical protein
MPYSVPAKLTDNAVTVLMSDCFNSSPDIANMSAAACRLNSRIERALCFEKKLRYLGRNFADRNRTT